MVKSYFTRKKFIRMMFFICLCISSTAFSANKIKSIKCFSITVPDTVTQGINFDAIYTLEATNYKDIHINEKAGITLIERKTYTLTKTPYQQLNVMATFYTTQVGHVKLPPMKAEIDGHEVESDPKEVFVKPHPQYGEEMTVAYKWLVKKGANGDSLTFNVVMPITNFFFFSDTRHHCFCLVAKKDMWDCAGDPVWAYSLESGFGKQSLPEIAPFFFNLYSEQLAAMKESGRRLPKTSGNMEPVSPMLGGLRWGQKAPYNAKLPTKNGKRVIVGCVPLSMAMVMKYHEWPKQGASTVNFKTENRKFQFDCTELKPQWDQYRGSYNENETEESTELSKVLGTLGLIMNPTYEENGTSANLFHIKHIMCNNLGYSGRLTLNAKPSNTEALNMLGNEIKNHRPCIVSKNSHAFVCDGYEEGFFHFNIGWKGFGNGYYRLGEYLGEKEKSLFRAIVTGIEPQKSYTEKEVTLQKAGTLSALLSNDEQENLVSLTISGPLNSSDIRLIRAMAGAKGDSLYNKPKMGTLRILDLTNATITSDETSYRTIKAANTFYGYTYNSYDGHRGYKYNFNNMDEKQWKEFKSNFGRMAKENGLSFTRISDTEYMESSFCIKNTITEKMFADCTSLYIIKLPQNTKTISNHAFFNCNSLQSVQFPSKTVLGKDVFQDCPALIETSYFGSKR